MISLFTNGLSVGSIDIGGEKFEGPELVSSSSSERSRATGWASRFLEEIPGVRLIKNVDVLEVF